MTTQKGQQQSPIGWIITLGGIASALAGIFACLAYFGLKPPIIIKEPTPTPSLMRGELSNVSVEHDVSFEDHMNRLGWSLAGYTEEQRQWFGAIVSVSEEIVGFSGQQCRIRWAVYDSVQRKRVMSSTSDFEIFVTPESETDRASVQVWIRYPDEAGTYLARIELYDPDNVLLHYIETEEFRLTVE